MGATGSENTGQAAGAAGLLASYGAQQFAGSPVPGRADAATRSASS